MGQPLSQPRPPDVSDLSRPLLPNDEAYGSCENNNNTGVTSQEDNGDDEEEQASSAEDPARDDDVNPAHEDEEELVAWIHQPFLPLKSLSIGGLTLIEGAAIVSFLKFALLAILQIICVHALVRWLDWEHDPLNTLEAILLYQSNLLWLDLAVFFVVGRCPEVDTAAWMIITSTAAAFTSWITRFPFLQHSATLFEMNCTWSWSTWFYAIAVLGLGIVLVVLHVRYALQHSRLASKLLEVVLTALAMFGPSLVLGASDFHLHHWLAGWWLGMHCNFPASFSRLCMAWCWGIYLNGIAVYGRDPVEVCGYIDYYYHDQHCHGPSSMLQGASMLQGDNPADWRNCSASGYHP
jgi:hypothetical protein